MKDSPKTRTDQAPHIEDTPPRRVHDLGDLIRATAGLVSIAIISLIAVYLRGVASGVESDVHKAGSRMDWLADVPTALLQQTVTVAVVIAVLVHLLFSREWLQSITAPLALFCGYGIIWIASTLIVHSTSLELINAFSSQSAIGSPVLLPDMYAGLAAFLSAAGPQRMRSSVKWGWNALYIVALIMVVISANSISAVLVSLLLGRSVGMVIRFAAGTQNKGVWGADLVQTLKSIGLEVVSLTRTASASEEGNLLEPTLDDDLVESSRIYQARTVQGQTYTVSVLDGQLHTAGYLMQLWQWIKLSGVSMRRDRSVRDSNQHHMAMLLGLRELGLPAMHPYGLAENGESSVFVLRDDERLNPIGPGQMSQEDARSLMDYLAQAHARGYTHRRITPDALARDQEGRALLAGWQNGDPASSSANMALDKVQLLALAASRIGTDTAIQTARSAWGDKTLISLIPFIQMVAVPKATRAQGEWSKQTLTGLREAVRALAPTDTTAQDGPVVLSRFSLRSFLALVLLVVAVVVVITQLNLQQVIEAARNADPWMAGMAFGFGCLTWVGCALTLGVFIDRDKRHPLTILISQVASSFTSVSMPAGVGPAFVNLQYLRRNGYNNTLATAIMSAIVAVQFATTFLLLVVIGLFTGRNTLSGMIPTNTLVIVIGVVAIVTALAMAIPYTRRMIVERLLPIVASYARQLVDVLTQPRRLALAALGAVIQSASLGLSFWASLMAFGWHTNVFETTFVFLLANTLGSAVPTPGGLGAIEAVLFSAFRLAGVPSAVAISATLVFRLVTYWLRIPLGATAMSWLGKRNLI
ncbi:putative membrane protein [Bifidobacterium actinocoloniiforme DSM 22766]|uniref:Putative membrane protein n=1 Tax=Bifidobacterium actinocoloniiforme DSM 22766 TaxID=1437605 RepID=A0A086Z180_9BIFI|nr:lysylphosphatidylglycerol synthase transmembrane domain-containing protein [Bifidobacterium actinocoloniiforme]AKV55444.1 membrane protein [Bifidobacterium actinocoloniiforme DSM 22766]KFI40280.1 putative membrane protein [Bifidobacterium actinocoloniiforme DSM 22766]